MALRPLDKFNEVKTFQEKELNKSPYHTEDYHYGKVGDFREVNINGSSTIKFLGAIRAGVTASGAAPIGSITINAGEFQKGDQLFFDVEGRGMEVYANIVLTAGANTLTFATDFSASSVSAVPLAFQGYARMMFTSVGADPASTIGIMHANGASISTTGAHRVVSGTMPSDWITGEWTITLEGGGNDSAQSFIGASFYKIGGSRTTTVINGDI